MGKMNVLVVEDHNDTRTMLSRLLAHCGHEPISASNVTEALELLMQREVDVLLSDLSLPDGDGLDLVVKAKALRPQLRTIALTGRDSADDRRLSGQAGFDHYLTKPFDFHKLRVILS